MQNQSLILRKAVISTLKADPLVASIVGARVYDEVIPKPEWPFVRYGTPITTEFLGQCWEGEAHRLTVHGFSKGPGRDPVDALAFAIKQALHEKKPIYEGASVVESMIWRQTSVLRDLNQATAYHVVVEFDAATAEIAA